MRPPVIQVRGYYWSATISVPGRDLQHPSTGMWTREAWAHWIASLRPPENERG